MGLYVKIENSEMILLNLGKSADWTATVQIDEEKKIKYWYFESALFLKSGSMPSSFCPNFFKTMGLLFM